MGPGSGISPPLLLPTAYAEGIVGSVPGFMGVQQQNSGAPSHTFMGDIQGVPEAGLLRAGLDGTPFVGMARENSVPCVGQGVSPGGVGTARENSVPCVG